MILDDITAAFGSTPEQLNTVLGVVLDTHNQNPGASVAQKHQKALGRLVGEAVPGTPLPNQDMLNGLKAMIQFAHDNPHIPAAAAAKGHGNK